MKSPKDFGEIAERVGANAAWNLYSARPGHEFYCPQTPPEADHWLARTLEPKDLAALCASFGGERLNLPGVPDPTRHRIEILLRNHLAVRDIALLTGRSERHIHSIKSELEQVAEGVPAPATPDPISHG